MFINKTALIATNDVELKSKLLMLLEQKRWQTMSSSRGSEAILTVLEKDIQLIILDIELEGMSGVEIIPILKKSRPKIPIIVVSGDESVKTGSEVLQHGIFYYLFKPLNLTEVNDLLAFVPY
jgi:DNA-binding NtrC family response regulator